MIRTDLTGSTIILVLLESEIHVFVDLLTDCAAKKRT